MSDKPALPAPAPPLVIGSEIEARVADLERRVDDVARRLEERVRRAREGLLETPPFEPAANTETAVPDASAPTSD